MAILPEFNLDLFKKERYFEEVPLLDRKSIIKLWDQDSKIKFIKHIISLANTARMLGKNAYLLFGIENDPPHRLCGIGEMWDHFERQCLKRLGVETISDECNVWEEMQNAISDIITTYIDPLVNWVFVHGIDPETNVRLAYIQISPRFVQPHKAKKSLTGIRERLIDGDAFIRFGESKRQVGIKDLSDLSFWPYSYAECPFLFRSDWEIYLNNIGNIFFQFAEVSHYIEPCGNNGEPINLINWVNSQSNNRLVIITGEAGSGKTLLLSIFLKSVLMDALAKINPKSTSDEDIEYSLPKGLWMPYFCPLSGISAERAENLIETLQENIATVTNYPGFKKIPPLKNIQHILEYPNINWIIGFDGLDEMWTEDSKRHFIQSLRKLLELYGNVKVVLTMRSTDLTYWQGIIANLAGKVIQINNFTIEQVRQLLLQNVRPEEISDKKLNDVIEWLSQNNQLYELLSNPLCLTGGIPYLIPVIQEFMKQPQHEGSAKYLRIRPWELRRRVPRQKLKRHLRRFRARTYTYENRQKILLFSQNSIGEETIENIPLMITQPNRSSQLNDTSELNNTTKGITTSTVAKGLHTSPTQSLRNTNNDDNTIMLIRVGELLRSIYSDLQEREKIKQQRLTALEHAFNIDGLWRELYKLALKTDGKFTRFPYEMLPHEIRHEQALNWILSLGVIRKVQGRDMYQFQTELTKCYFATEYIIPYIQIIDQFIEIKNAFEDTTESFKLEMQKMMYELQP